MCSLTKPLLLWLRWRKGGGRQTQTGPHSPLQGCTLDNLNTPPPPPLGLPPKGVPAAQELPGEQSSHHAVLWGHCDPLSTTWLCQRCCMSSKTHSAHPHSPAHPHSFHPPREKSQFSLKAGRVAAEAREYGVLRRPKDVLS